MPPPVLKTVLNNMSINARSASESAYLIPGPPDRLDLMPQRKCIPVVQRFPIKCTNCCCTLPMNVNKKDGEGRASPGVTAIRVPNYSEFEVPMSLILSSLLNLPKDSACISNLSFCLRCAKILAQIFDFIRALEKFSQPESQLNYIQNLIRSILNKSFAPVRNDAEANMNSSAKSSTHLGIGTRSPATSMARSVSTVTPSKAKKSSFWDSFDNDEPADFSSDSEPFEMGMKPDIHCFTPPPEVHLDKLTVAKHTNKRIDPVVLSPPKVTERPEILTASKLVQRLKAGNSGKLVPPQNSSKLKKPQCGLGFLKSWEMVKSSQRQKSPEITVVPGFINVRAQLTKPANLDPATASHGSSRRKQILKPVEHDIDVDTVTETETMLVDEASDTQLVDIDETNESEVTVPLPVLAGLEAAVKQTGPSVPKRVLVYYQRIAGRRFQGNCSKCAHTFSNASLLDIEKHFDDEHDGTLESICNFCEERLPLNNHCVTLHYKNHFMQYEMELKKNFRSLCGLDLTMYTSPCVEELDQPGASAQVSQWRTIAIEERKAKDRARYLRRKAIKLSRRKLLPRINHGTCPYCAKSYVNRMHNWMEMHIKLSHRHQSRYCCDICGKPCQSSTNMKAHKRSHLNLTERQELDAEQGIPKKELLCSDCGQVLASEYTLKIHQRNQHGDQEARRICCQEPGCEFSCVSKKSLTKHHAQFHDPNSEPRFYCKQCNKGFRVHADLKQHEMLECDFWNRPFACDQPSCNRRFKAKQGMVVHLNGFHKMSPEEARAKVYPGLDCPAWVGRKRKFKSWKDRTAFSSRRRRV